jgi:hypothetical protein
VTPASSSGGGGTRPYPGGMARSKPTDSPAPAGKAGRAPGSGGRSRGATAAGATASGAAGKPAKAAKAQKLGKDGQPKVGRIAKLRKNVGMMKQAYSLTYKNDRKLPWLMLIAFVVVFGVVELIGILVDAPLFTLFFALVAGLLAALIVFGRRAQGSAYRQVEGQPGAAAWVLEGMRGDWRVSSGVAGTTQLDTVHRVLGRPGVVLVAEGVPSRVRPLLAQEKKKLARIVGDTPIYDITVGDDEGQVPLKKLSTHVAKLPRNLSPAEVNALARRMSALGGPKMPVPGGPLPGGKQMSVSQRQVRRR